MHSHFSSIGFDVSTAQELQDMLRSVLTSASIHAAKGGRYLHWSSYSGAELWVSVDDRKELLGISPHFRGRSRVRVRIESWEKGSADNPLEGAAYGWADPSSSSPSSGAYPFAFTLPDFQLHSSKALPLVVVAQIAAFADDLHVYESEEAFDTSQAGSVKLAPKSFIPAGLFDVVQQDQITRDPCAIIAGKVRRHQERVNQMSGNHFHWALIDTLGGSYDVVMPEAPMTKSLHRGAIVHGTFWLSGILG